ncbi:alpha/beta hydrolase [Luteibacter aegosomatis]|uniref:alpha/beta fold hydrolase n=1 Tax=Luteibacter aegosomatis TaxID=2911537 RepID=UPI001FF7C6F8|nr:alpha/beta hydrolase [Luteibacter aegosomatis]UPG85802.1 alpha/beta hydrolase [Luteibacter aegosomatis]
MPGKWPAVAGRYAYDALVSVEAWLSGMRRRSIRAGDLRLAVNIAGRESHATVLLLHGFTGNRHVWTRVARRLRSRFRIIAPDLPGHGDSDPLPDNHGAHDHARRIVAMLDGLGVRQVHIVASSFGGAIATCMNAGFPSRVASLVLLAPVGVPSPHASAFDLTEAQGGNPFVIGDRAEFDAFHAAIMSRPPWIPRIVRAHIAALFVAKRKWISQMHRGLAASRDLGSLVGSLTVPTLLIWGRNDKVVDESAALVWVERSEHCGLQRWEGIGHLPMLEAPERLARAIVEFIEPLQSTPSRQEAGSP